MTNKEKLMTMSNEELAKLFIKEDYVCEFCSEKIETCSIETSCVDNICKWLESEASNDR